jgi:hypothetical protein
MSQKVGSDLEGFTHFLLLYVIVCCCKVPLLLIICFHYKFHDLFGGAFSGFPGGGGGWQLSVYGHFVPTSGDLATPDGNYQYTPICRMGSFGLYQIKTTVQFTKLPKTTFFQFHNY